MWELKEIISTIIGNPCKDQWGEKGGVENNPPFVEAASSHTEKYLNHPTFN